jgi:hypothetical protein
MNSMTPVLWRRIGGLAGEVGLFNLTLRNSSMA